MSLETENRNYPIPDASADPEESVTEAVEKSRDATIMIDADIAAILTALNGKAPVTHTHTIAQIDGLSAALAAKMAASQTFKLDDLTDVDGADVAATGYVLIKTPGGQWAGQAALAALGDHEHTISEVIGLGAALADHDTHLAAHDTQFSSTNTALAARLRVDADQGLTAAQMRQARNNIQVSDIKPKNWVQNGEFQIAQRGVGPNSANGYTTVDRWSNFALGNTNTLTRVLFPVGSTLTPSKSGTYLRANVASVANTANYSIINQSIEGVQSLSGKLVTLTFWARADTATKIAIEFVQNFGTGGSPSAQVSAIGSQIVNITSTWAKYTVTVAIPSVFGKILGANSDDALVLNIWLNAGATHNSRTASLGQTGQSGNFEFTCVSINEGDTTGLTDPYEYLSIGQYLEQCMRYYEDTGSVDNIGIQRSDGLVQYFVTWDFKVRKRTVPSISFTNPGSAAFGVYESLPNRAVLLMSSGGAGGVFAVQNLKATAEL